MRELRGLMLLSLVLLVLPCLRAQPAQPTRAPTDPDLVAEHIKTLETMISLWPKRDYYLQLASQYGLVGDLERQLELYEISHAMGWLTETWHLVQLARLLLRAERIDEVDEVLGKALEVELARMTLDAEKTAPVR